MDCEECVRLTTEYESLKKIHAATISELSAKSDFIPAEEYLSLRKTADEARLDAKVASLALEMHKRIHRQTRLTVDLVRPR